MIDDNEKNNKKFTVKDFFYFMSLKTINVKKKHNNNVLKLISYNYIIIFRFFIVR